MNSSALPMTDGDLALLLVASAQGDQENGCPDPTCPGCDAFRRVWWDTLHRIVSHEAEAVMASLRGCGVQAPPLPTPEDLL